MIASPARLFDARPASYLRRAGGRETFAWKEGPSGEVIVKRMPGRGGRREHDNLEALRAHGVAVPRPIAWSQERATLSLTARRSLVVMERIEHAETLRERLARAGASERSRWSDELLAIVSTLHARGWYHRDLYLQHFLVASAPRGEHLVLIDVGRARWRARVRRRWFVKDLAALLHSTPAEISASERFRFLSRYLDRRGIHARFTRSAFARAVVRKARRMSSHVPHEERR